MSTTTPDQPQPPTEAAVAGVRVTAADFSYHHADRSQPAFAGLNLDIAPGEKVLLAGASGAGKSTLLHAIAGVLQDDDADSAGELRLDGLHPEQARGRAGLMQQDPESQVVLSRIGDDVAFACENLAVPPAEIPDRCRYALKAVGLGHLRLDHSTGALSGGQKQRLALASILAMRPGLLLLDEPTANLDPEGAEQVRDSVLAAAQATGATMIVVEHRLEAWLDEVDTLVVLEPGGGIRHRVPADTLYQDQALRTELISAGLWVPHHDALGSLPTWVSPDRRSHTEGSAVLPLLVGEGLAVSRESPGRSWRKALPPQPVLDEVDITLSSGVATGITGRNGAGKSTLLLTLGGLLAPHAGSITASTLLKGGHGDQLADSPHEWRSADLTSRIGTVFQEPEHQFVRHTVADELRLSAEQARIPGTKKPLFTDHEVADRVSQLLHRLRLTHLAAVNPFTLSGGEKRRLSVGTALAAGPEVLMLDEPTFGQDAHTFVELVGLLREHLDSGGTVVAVTHDQHFLRALSARTFQVTGAEPHRSPAPESGNSRVSSTPLFSAVRDVSWLGQRGPLAKLVALCCITLALISTIDPVSATVVAAASFALLPLANIRLGTFLKRIWIFAVAAVMAVWGAAIAAEESGRVLLDLGVTTVSTGSLEMGLSLGARAFAIVLPSVLIFSTTDPTDLADALAQQLKLPARFVLGALAGMRLLGLMAAHWTTLGHARRARGLGARFFSQAFGLLVQAIRIATRLAVTMESRGFGAGERTWSRAARFTTADGGVVLGGVFVAGSATTLAVIADTWNLVWM
ncbi:ATP-binding cassette domain-containing protein [Nesterenkonia natronophila]|uniref:ATP-binding cassette domain-containing protein n=1 Tax=Nesterenkonia natronophila TaxID=2174932 RepID=A0A3A4F4R4_9MICC|nr:ATP-binding cassette domain-containing protein [Nesterenkonia natronophila]RJN32711.1 ATP-binding cassette domain-containing protein [Nesterenkonia natronophila]